MIIDTTEKFILTIFEKLLIQKSLEQDHVVAFPTDTVYGLGANGYSKTAIQKLYAAKGRDENKPLILLTDSIEKIKPYTTDLENPLLIYMKENWPGPVTIILPFNPASSLVFSKITCTTLGIRIPNHPLLLDLLTSLPFPVVTTSANKTGQEPLTTAIDIDNAFNNPGITLSIIIDGGILSGKPSKIVHYQSGNLRILRS
jgi:L-threonylcarbamoyladenylate synthase